MYKNLFVERKKNKLTVIEMGKVISKSPATYYKKETGFVNTTVQEAIRISQKLEKPIEYLFEEFSEAED